MLGFHKYQVTKHPVCHVKSTSWDLVFVGSLDPKIISMFTPNLIVFFPVIAPKKQLGNLRPETHLNQAKPPAVRLAIMVNCIHSDMDDMPPQKKVAIHVVGVFCLKDGMASRHDIQFNIQFSQVLPRVGKFVRSHQVSVTTWIRVAHIPTSTGISTILGGCNGTIRIKA